MQNLTYLSNSFDRTFCVFKPLDRYDSDLRIWKLTGLICAYSVAVGVNLGLTFALFIGDGCGGGGGRSRRCKRGSSALFVPWLVINLVREH